MCVFVCGVVVCSFKKSNVNKLVYQGKERAGSGVVGSLLGTSDYSWLSFTRKSQGMELLVVLLLSLM